MVKKQKLFDVKEDESDLHDENNQEIEDLELLKLNEEIYDSNLFKEFHQSDIGGDLDFVETTFNLDEFDVHLDRNEFFNDSRK